MKNQFSGKNKRLNCHEKCTEKLMCTTNTPSTVEVDF